MRSERVSTYGYNSNCTYGYNSNCTHSPWVQLELYPWVQLELYLWVQRAPCARRAQRSISKNLTHDRCNARLRTPTQKRRLRTPAQKRRLRTPAQKRRLRTPAPKRRTTTPTQKVFCLFVRAEALQKLRESHERGKPTAIFSKRRKIDPL